MFYQERVFGIFFVDVPDPKKEEKKCGFVFRLWWVGWKAKKSEAQALGGLFYE